MKTNENILFETAISLFKEKGYKNVTVNQICEACHVTKGSFYHHFKNKEEILQIFYNQLYKNPEELLLELVKHESYRDKLWCVLEYGMIPTIALGPDLMLEMIKIQSSSQQILSTQKYTTDLILSFIQKAQENGEIHATQSADELWFAYKNGLFGIAMDWSVNDGKFDEIAYLKRLFNIIFY